MTHLLFVYGTLKEGFPNFGVNGGVRVGRDARTRDRLPLYLVGERRVPWLLQQPGVGFQVVGQVFAVDGSALEAMDRLEGTNEADGYRKVTIEVERVVADQAAAQSVYCYLKLPSQLDESMERAGPLEEYTLAHAALYRRRMG